MSLQVREKSKPFTASTLCFACSVPLAGTDEQTRWHVRGAAAGFWGHCRRGSGTRHHASTGTVAWALHGLKGFETRQSALPADTFELSRNPVVTQRHGPEVTLSVTQITAAQGPAGTQAHARCVCSPARARLTPTGCKCSCCDEEGCREPQPSPEASLRGGTGVEQPGWLGDGFSPFLPPNRATVRAAERLLQDREHPQDRPRLHTGPRGWASSMRAPPSPSPAITHSQEEVEEGISPPSRQSHCKKS